MRPLIVDGNWGAFGQFGVCSRTCGGGTQMRTRVCNNPAPTSGGRSCAGKAIDSRPCGTAACAGKIAVISHCPIAKSILISLTAGVSIQHL